MVDSRPDETENIQTHWLLGQKQTKTQHCMTGLSVKKLNHWENKWCCFFFTFDKLRPTHLLQTPSLSSSACLPPPLSAYHRTPPLPHPCWHAAIVVAQDECSFSAAVRPTEQRAHPGSVYIYVAFSQSFKSQRRAGASTAWEHPPHHLSSCHLYQLSSISVWFSSDHKQLWGEEYYSARVTVEEEKKIKEKEGVWQNASLIQLPFCLPLFNLSAAYVPPLKPPTISQSGEGFSMWLAFLSSQPGPL